MPMYSLTKFARTYSTHFCWFFRSVRKNSRNPSLEAPKNTNAHEHPLLPLRSYRPVFKNVAETAI
jgi:hypothetical protein